MHSVTGHFARTFRVVRQVIRHPVLRRVALVVLAALTVIAALLVLGVGGATLVAPQASLVAPILIVIAGVGLTVMDIAGRTILQRVAEARIEDRDASTG